MQRRTVAEYQNESEMLINRVTGISESLLKTIYISGLKVALQIELLRAKPTTLVEALSLARIIDTRFEAIAHEEKATTEKEQIIKETADTITSLQSDVASLKAKGSLDANEEIKKDHTLVHDLVKQVKKLPMELQLKNNFREALETTSKDLDKTMLDLNLIRKGRDFFKKSYLPLTSRRQGLPNNIWHSSISSIIQSTSTL
nr:myosin heavy chain-related protein [Tanacetum cinerariifolium]